MASPAPIIARSEKRKLLQEFVAAVSEVNRIHSAQVVAVLNGDGFLFQDELHKAMSWKEKAKYAVLVHQQEYGC